MSSHRHARKIDRNRVNPKLNGLQVRGVRWTSNEDWGYCWLERCSGRPSWFPRPLSPTTPNCSSRSMRCSGSCRRCRRSWPDQEAGQGGRAAGARQQAQQAQQQQAQNVPANIPPNLYAADVPVPTKGPPSWFDSIHVSMAGSFIAMEGAWRQRNEISSGASDPPSAPSRSRTRRSTTRTSCASAPSRAASLEGVGRHRSGPARRGLLRNGLPWRRVDRNSRESNSYNPRIRQAYFAYDNDYWHSHFSAGQMWSLLTQNRVGMLNRN